ncbi:unnamed protein product [Miscanthus lutarioriparius]|uniref:Uncharacterized protein n=1 Tax=Miscanthus lutarioriparius TaxID=422564 RepID=A0A811RL83_9POAL|nr:unnamed protein product [Miscanthus lutarioriparius]
MAAWNRSRDVNSDPEHSGRTSRPPLPRPDNGDNVCPVPLWEREFCRNAYDIPWEIFCDNKRFIEILFKNVMDWDDSGALKNFEDAKERFRAKYFGKPYEDPVLDPDIYIDEVDNHCKVDPELVAGLDKIAGLDLVADLGLGGMGNMTPMDWGAPIGNLIPTGWGQPVPNLKPTGWGDPANPTPDTAWGGQGNQRPEAVRGAQPSCTPNNSNINLHGGRPSNNLHQQGVDPGHPSSGTARMLPGGGRIWISGVIGGGGGAGRNWNGGGGGGGRGSNWNSGGRGNQMNQAGGQNQQRNRGSMQRNQNVWHHQMRSIGRQQQGQRGRKMEWRPVQHNRAPKDDPAA